VPESVIDRIRDFRRAVELAAAERRVLTSQGIGLFTHSGVHDPAAMPFEVAWTDTLSEESFVAHHRDKPAACTPED
jgi:hypothetical protein